MAGGPDVGQTERRVRRGATVSVAGSSVPGLVQCESTLSRGSTYVGALLEFPLFPR